MAEMIPAAVAGALDLLNEYHEANFGGGEPHYPHEAARIVDAYQETLTRQIEAIGLREQEKEEA